MELILNGGDGFVSLYFDLGGAICTSFLVFSCSPLNNIDNLTKWVLINLIDHASLVFPLMTVK